MGKKRIIIDNDTQEVYEGVTRFDNGKVEHGDRHDAAFDEMRRRIKNAPESAKHIPPVRDFQQEREAREWPEVRERLVKSHGEYMTSQYEDKRFNGGREAKRKAQQLAEVRQAQSARSDLHGTPTPGYVPPNEKPINGYAVLALVACLSVLLVKTITGG